MTPEVSDTTHELAVRERQNFGKKEDYGTLFQEKAAYNISFRGAQPLPDDRFERYKDTTLSDIFYILRIRMHEPLIFESRGADVLLNAPVEIVDITDGDNHTTTVYFHQITKLPVREVFYRRNPVTKDKDEEITRFFEVSRSGWHSVAIRHGARSGTAKKFSRYSRTP